MPRKSPFTEKEKEIIKDLYCQGHGSPYIADYLNKKRHIVAGYISRHIGSRPSKIANRKYYHNDNYFHNIDTEEKAYWLGFIYADGYISKVRGYKIVGITLSIDDKFHLEKFKKAIEATNPIKIYKQTSGYSNKEYCRLIINGENLFDDLLNHGVFENKTLILEPPNIDKKFYKDFIRGYIDGDGCIAHTSTTDKYALKIVGVEKVLDFIKSFIEEYTNIKIHRYYKRRPTDIVSSIEVGGNNQVKNILDIIYGNSQIYLDRKYNRYINLKNKQTCRVASKETA